ncbi:MAG: helicase-related protein, partial [Candidatus Competibacteraceae bacterium]|nr:helicase-related protein [Candidatus Competibacteraceae bacterium]
SLLDQIHRGQRRILLGTQMLAKGHHFPEVTLVGIVAADQGLFGSDFRAPEQMAQQIIQVAGRAGRADKPGKVALQTHHPEHPLLHTLLQHGYPAFAAATLEERRQAGLPPFGCQALVRADSREADTALAFLERARELGQPWLPQGVELLGPVPAPMERRAGRWRAQLLVQAGQRRELHGFLGRWAGELEGLPGVRKVRWSLDVDPMEML